MTHKVGIKGQVVIPKAIRDEIGIEPGDEVTFEADRGAVRVVRLTEDPKARAESIRSLRGAWADTAAGGTEDLVAERRADRAREERRARELGVGRPR